MTPPTTPEEWTVGELGRPDWFWQQEQTVAAAWAFVIPPPLHPAWTSVPEAEVLPAKSSLSPLEMPVITGDASDAPPEPIVGRPNVSRSRPFTTVLAAAMHDIHGVSYPVIADGLSLAGSDLRSTRRKAKRYVAAGRELLHDAAVLPWLGWPLGKLGDEWWRSGELATNLDRWCDASEKEGQLNTPIVRVDTPDGSDLSRMRTVEQTEPWDR